MGAAVAGASVVGSRVGLPGVMGAAVGWLVVGDAVVGKRDGADVGANDGTRGHSSFGGSPRSLCVKLQKTNSVRSKVNSKGIQNKSLRSNACLQI
jgi:hypothetical protein